MSCSNDSALTFYNDMYKAMVESQNEYSELKTS